MSKVAPSRPPDTSSKAYRKALAHHLATASSPAPDAETLTPFRAAEKYYKSKFPNPDLGGVLDVAVRDIARREEIENGWWKGSSSLPNEELKEIALRSEPGKKAYTIPSIPGLVLLPSFLPPPAQRTLIRTSLLTAASPNETNLDTHYYVPRSGLWSCALSSPHDPILPKANVLSESPSPTPSPSLAPAPTRRTLISNPPASLPSLTQPKPQTPPTPSPRLTPALPAQLLPKLRWANIGASYHWTSKSYDLSKPAPAMDEGVRGWCRRAVGAVSWGEVLAEGEEEGWADDYEPDAGIVNFYQLGDTLMAHVDHSELDARRPLVSISLGHACVFLLGGATRSTPPTPVLLRSGDVLIMSGPCRRFYHGVPRVLEGTLPSHLWDEIDGEDEEEWRPFREYLASARINVNVRQVFPSGMRPDEVIESQRSI